MPGGGSSRRERAGRAGLGRTRYPAESVAPATVNGSRADKNERASASRSDGDAKLLRGFFEISHPDFVFLQQIVEIRAIFSGDLGSPGGLAVAHLQKPGEIGFFKLRPRFLECLERSG